MSATVVISTGTANVTSVLAGLKRVGLSADQARRPEDISRAERVILPGVGAFGAAMENIDRQGLRSVLVDHVEEGKPLLAICLGMQLLCSGSEESPRARGLGVIDQPITRLPDTVRVPQLGWNTVDTDPGARLVSPGWAYFANSYRLTGAPPGWTAASTEYGTRFVSALERGDQLACQFHPELSGPWGARILSRWTERTKRGA